MSVGFLYEAEHTSAYVGCMNRDCQMRGPLESEWKRAEEAWDALPRRQDQPNGDVLLLVVDETEYRVSFMHSGMTTFCGITWEEDDRQHGVYGASHCNPKDTFDAKTGEKVAMRKACGVGMNDWFGMPAFLPKVYSAYRMLMRANKEGRPYAAPVIGKQPSETAPRKWQIEITCLYGGETKRMAYKFEDRAEADVRCERLNKNGNAVIRYTVVPAE